MKRKHEIVEIFAPMKTKKLNWWKRNHEIEKILAKMKKKTNISGAEKDIFAVMKKKACDRMETSKSPLFDKMPATRAPASSEINYRLELLLLWWGWSIIIKYVKLSNIKNIINIIKYQIIGRVVVTLMRMINYHQICGLSDGHHHIIIMDMKCRRMCESNIVWCFPLWRTDREWLWEVLKKFATCSKSPCQPPQPPLPIL